MEERIFAPIGTTATGAASATEENPERIGEPDEDPPLFTFIHDFVLRPIGIGGSHDGSANADRMPAARFYERGWGPKPVLRHGVHVWHPRNLSCYAGAMAFLSPPSDLARFGVATMSGALLSPDTVRMLQTSQRVNSGGETGHGLGWDLSTATLGGGPVRVVGHVAQPPLPGAALLTFPDQRLVVAMVSNLTSADSSALALRIAESFVK